MRTNQENKDGNQKPVEASGAPKPNTQLFAQPQAKKSTTPAKFHVDHDMYWPRLGF